ncbi:Uncharacterised protein [Mycobacteroides abscessus subsp. abscessus]|nr:Uncharacterised protein [Mycobacteroides abscessus subsp. abscessus]
MPPVWQVGQYWNDLSANDTSRTTSPHTGQGIPVRACTRNPDRFSPLRVAACCPTLRSTASVRTDCTASYNAVNCPSDSVFPLAKGDSLATCRISSL